MPWTTSTIMLAMARASFIGFLPERRLPWRYELPVRTAEEGPDDDQNDVHEAERAEQEIRQEALAGEPSADAAGLAVEVWNKQQDKHFDRRYADPAPERRVADELLKSE